MVEAAAGVAVRHVPAAAPAVHAGIIDAALDDAVELAGSRSVARRPCWDAEVVQVGGADGGRRGQGWEADGLLPGGGPGSGLGLAVAG